MSLLFHLGTNVESDGTCQTMLHLYTLKSHLSFLSSFPPHLFLHFLLYYGNEASAQTTIPAYCKPERSTGAFSGVDRTSTFLATSIENMEIMPTDILQKNPPDYLFYFSMTNVLGIYIFSSISSIFLYFKLKWPLNDSYYS